MSNEVPDGFVDGTDLIDGLTADCDAHLSPQNCSRCNPLACICPCHTEANQ